MKRLLFAGLLLVIESALGAGITTGFNGPIPSTFASLPSNPPVGSMRMCTDCSATDPLAGGGSTNVPVYFNGSAWVRFATGSTGSGTVTSVGSGTIGSLFTVSWANQTTTPSLSLDITNQGTTTTVLHGNAAGHPSFGPIVTADLPATAVTPGSYTNTNLTIDSTGRITAAANGSGGSGVTGTGTLNTIPKVTNATGPVIGDSSLKDDGTQVTTTEKFGVGTTTPAFNIQAIGDIDAIETGGNAVRGIISTQISNDSNSAHFSGRRARGTPASPTTLQSADFITCLTPNPYDGTSYLIPGVACFVVDNTVSTGSVPVSFIVNTGTGVPGDGTTRLTVQSDGKVRINTTDNVGQLNIAAPAGNTNGLRVANNTSGAYSTTYFNNAATGGLGLYVDADQSYVKGFQKDGGTCSVASDQTNATTTQQTAACYNIFPSTAISLRAGRIYSGRCTFFLSDSTAADGAAIDFGASTATATFFRAEVRAYDSSLNTISQVTGLTTAISAATFTGSGVFYADFAFKVNATGTFQPRFFQASHSTGTLTLAQGSNCVISDTSQFTN